MRAAVWTGPGEPLATRTLELDAPRAGEVAVRLLASGVCHSDLHVADGDWPEQPPFVLGHEGAGLVEAVGEGVTHVGRGDRVVIAWYAPCQACPRCAEGRPWLCSGSRSLDHELPDGTSRLHLNGETVRPYLAVGSFAERAVVTASAAVPVPEALPAEVAALIACGVATGVGAVVNTARVEPGAAVAVVGCGGVGLSVVLGAALAGADPIVAVDLHEDKLALARDLGATHGVRAGERAARELRRICRGGADYAFEAVGLAETIEWAIDATRPGGRAVLVGMTAKGVRPSFDAFRFVAAGRTLQASFYGSTRPHVDFPRLARLHLAGKLPVERLITHRIALDELDEALGRLRRGEGGRSVLVLG